MPHSHHKTVTTAPATNRRLRYSLALIGKDVLLMPLPEVIVYSKPACCLCSRAMEQLAKLQEQHPFVMREINILEDSEAYNKFKEEIPVIFVNGRKAFKYHVDETAFVQMIKSADSGQQPEGTPGD